MSTGVIILAAGAATRIGRAKMLLPYQSTNLLLHLVQEVKQIQPQHLLIVTGFYHQLILEQMNWQKDVDIVYNENWQKGMATSIQKGIEHVMLTPLPATHLFLLVSDQPFLNSILLQNMLTLQQHTQKGIVAAEYDGILGTPVLFAEHYFAKLLELKGDMGARKIIHQYRKDLATIAFPLGGIDIDTPEDYEKFCLLNNENNAK
ncbi:MAG: nucleotidyltransferase family protein [Sphingobacteriales bacterium]|uniref:nucleotidyltransferase family protein n=1 Tax=Hydrotalea flava TaxID=714549 RepID=UPI00082EAF80|nr:nucleotidyltransferase family protein [Hydrotalea flava]RTL49330.1 MAG: nucleotidyltransferase family protein [Sphingobacteriales bacterium]